MSQNDVAGIINAMLENVETLVPLYMQQDVEKAKSNGQVAVCIIDAEGRIYGRMFGNTDKIRAREVYRVAWLKASQVWITGMKTGAYEQLVFNHEIDEKKFGIRRPDFIGWEGGQPLMLPDGTILAAGFSGFTSATDLELVLKAFEAAVS